MPGQAIWVGDMGGSQGWAPVAQAFGKGVGDQIARQLTDPNYQAQVARERALKQLQASGMNRAQAESVYATQAMDAAQKAQMALAQFQLSSGQQKLPLELQQMQAQTGLIGANTVDTQSQTSARDLLSPLQAQGLQSEIATRDALAPLQQRELASQTNERDSLLPWKIADYPHKWANDRAQIESQRLYYSQRAQQENDLEFLKLMVTSGDRNQKLMTDLNTRLSKPGIGDAEKAQARLDTAAAGIQGTLQMMQGMQATPSIAGKVDPQFLESEIASNIDLALETVSSARSPEQQAKQLKSVTAVMKQYRQTNPAIWQRYVRAVSQLKAGSTQKGMWQSLAGDSGLSAITGKRDTAQAFDPVAQTAAEVGANLPGMIPSGYQGMYNFESPEMRAQAIQGLAR